MSEDIKFVKGYFSRLEDEHISYCILRNNDEVENGDAHDIDMCIQDSNLEKAEEYLFEMSKENGWGIHLTVGSSKDKINIKCYHLYKKINSKIFILHFDVFPTFVWKGYVMLDNKDLLDGIRKENMFYRANEQVEAIIKLFIRLIYNGYVKEKYKNFIHKTFLRDPVRCKKVMSSFLEDRLVERVYNSVIENEWQSVEDDRNKYIDGIKKKAKCYKLGYYSYLASKIISRPGIMVAFEGTDGSGKSTIIERLPDVLGNTFPKDMMDYYHWRPAVIKKERRTVDGKPIVVSDPHAHKPYGFVKSFLKFMFFNVDYIVGYYAKVRWQLAKGHLVVFDRYYYDYYLDKIRYRLSISDAMLRFWGQFIPKPDVTFLLIGTPEILYKRKKEISVEEITTQIADMKKNERNFHNSIRINVDNMISDVVNDVALCILKQGEVRVKKREKRLL